MEIRQNSLIQTNLKINLKKAIDKHNFQSYNKGRKVDQGNRNKQRPSSQHRRSKLPLDFNNFQSYNKATNLNETS